MAQEVGAAYVTLMPSARGFGKQVEQEMGGGFANAEKQGTSAFSGLFKRVAGFAATAAVAVGGYFSAKKIFGGGLDRLLNIEDAQAKLKGLGHDAASVSTIMTSALDAVRGTAYGLDSAATVAASAVAAGIKPGEELTKYLTLTADAATIAGTSMDEMGSIMNKVTSSGFAMTDNLNQLADRGIPIFQWLQDEYGVSAEELRKMVSQGKVDAETFNRVISENIGGAALASGDTTRGAMANMGAALARVGANLLSGVFPLFKEVFQGITSLLGPVEDGAKQVGQAFGEWTTSTLIPAVKGVIDLLQGDFTPALREALGWDEDSGAVDTLLSIRYVAIGVTDSLRGVVAVIRDGDFNGGLFEWLGVQEDSPLIDTLFRIRDAASAIVPTVTGAFTAMVAAFQDGGTDITSSGLAGVFESIGLSARNFIDPLIPAFSALWSAIQPILPEVMKAVSAFSPLHLIVEALLPVLPQVAGLVGQLAGTLVGALGPVLVALVPALSQVAAVLIEGLAQAFVALLPIVPTIVSLVGSLASIFSGVLVTAINSIVPVLVELVTNVLGALVPMLPAISSLVSSLAEVFLSLVQAALPLIDPILQFVSAIAGALLPLLPTLLGLISSLANMFSGVLTAALNTIVPILVQLVTTVLGALTPLLPTITDMVGILADVFLTLVSALMPLLPPILQLVGALASALMPLLPTVAQLVTTVASVLVGLVQALSPLLPVITNLISVGLNVLVAVLTPLIDIIAMVADVVMTVLVVALNAIMPIVNGLLGVLTTFAQFLSTALAATVQGIADVISTVWNGIRAVTMGVWNAIKDAIMTPVNFVRDAVTGAFDFIRNGIEGAMNAMRDTISSIFGALVGIVKAPINTIIGLVNRAIDAVNGISVDIPSWVPGIGGSKLGFDIPNIPTLARGATVRPRFGGTLAVLAEAGRPESVVDTGLVNSQMAATASLANQVRGILASGTSTNINRAGLEGNTFNITTPDPVAAAEEVARRLWLLGA